MLIKREAPGFRVTIHVRNILLYCLIVQSQPYTIVIVNLRNKQQNEPCPPVTPVRLARAERLQGRQILVDMEIKHLALQMVSMREPLRKKSSKGMPSNMIIHMVRL